MMKSALGLATLLFLACGSACAADLDYSFLDLAYSKQSHDQLSGGSGYQLIGSYALGDRFFLDAMYKHNGFDPEFTSPLSPHFSNHSDWLGGGYHQGLSASSDLVARIMYGRGYSETEFDSISIYRASKSGYDVGIGVRGRPTGSLELEAFLDHDDLGIFYGEVSTCPYFYCLPVTEDVPDGSENSASVEARYYFIPAFSLGAEYRHSSLQSAKEWLVSGRWSF